MSINSSETPDHKSDDIIGNDSMPNAMAKLRWQCRRGMLELDLLLLPFLEARFPTLLPEEQKAFIELLSYPDQTLYLLFISVKEEQNLIESTIESSEEVLKIIQKIRNRE